MASNATDQLGTNVSLVENIVIGGLVIHILFFDFVIAAVIFHFGYARYFTMMAPVLR